MANHCFVHSPLLPYNKKLSIAKKIWIQALPTSVTQLIACTSFFSRFHIDEHSYPQTWRFTLFWGSRQEKFDPGNTWVAEVARDDFCASIVNSLHLLCQSPYWSPGLFQPIRLMQWVSTHSYWSPLLSQGCSFPVSIWKQDFWYLAFPMRNIFFHFYNWASASEPFLSVCGSSLLKSLSRTESLSSSWRTLD